MDFKKFFKKEKPDEKTYAKRAPRVRLTTLHNVRLVLESQSDEVLSLANISTTGLAFFITPSTPKPGMIVAGSIEINGSKYALKLKIVHVSGNIVGCSFDTPSLMLVRAIADYLNVEITAIQMTTVPQDSLNAEPEGTPHWFYGNNNCDLYYLSNGNEIVRFQLSFFGNHIEGGASIPLRTGHLVEDGFDKPSHKGTPVVDWGVELPPETITIGRRLLLGLEKLDKNHLKGILDLIDAGI